LDNNSRVQLSHYRVENEIGRGGMGVVYRAVDTRLGRAVAIKMLPQEATADAERRARFIQEARAASALNHPHIVTIYDVGEQDGATFIAMELLDGEPLDRRLRKGPIGVSEGLQLGRCRSRLRSRSLMAAGSSTATSSRPTSSSPATVAPRSSISGLPSWPSVCPPK
jgi:serine/threonine protein kinase